MTQALRANCIRVLVVEDNRDICENIGDYLGARGHITDFAHDGISAMHLALTDPIDVIILDLMLPGMSGFEVLEQLRAEESTRDIAVLMLTARKDEPDRIKGLSLGADDYLTKPFSPQELTLRVGAILRRMRGYAIPRGGGLVVAVALLLSPVACIGGDDVAVEERLFAGLADQAGLVLRGVQLRAALEQRLTELSAREAELRESRERLVDAA